MTASARNHLKHHASPQDARISLFSQGNSIYYVNCLYHIILYKTTSQCLEVPMLAQSRTINIISAL